MAERTLTGIGRTPRDSTPVLLWKNDSGETIPAFGCIKLDSYNNSTRLFSAVKPDGNGSLHFVNGPKSVAVGGYGESHLWSSSRIGKTSETFGTSVGPVAGSWEFSSSGSGFVVFSNPTSGTAAILQLGSTGSSSIRHAIVRECLGQGYYLAEFADFTPAVPSGDAGSGGCDPCNLISTDCDDPNDPESDRTLPAGTGDYVTVYDVRELPLTMDRHIIIANLGDAETPSGTSGDETVWIVLEANRPLTKLKVEDWDCCDGVVTRIACNFYLIEAVQCTGDETPCPSV